MSQLSKQSLLQQADVHSIIDALAQAWPTLLDEEQQELCLETIYDLLAQTAPKPENFSLLSNDDKAQHEIDVDMLLITIDFPDLKELIFDNGENEHYFWLVVDAKYDINTKQIIAALFN